MWLLSIILPVASAGDIYLLEDETGAITFTEFPEHNGYTLFLPDDPPPEVGQVNPQNFPMLNAYDDIIARAARRYGVAPELVKAICLAESGMNKVAVSHAGAMGLMQLMPGTADYLGVTDPYDPEQNIDGGARYISEMLRRFNDTRRAVAAYNAGPLNVEKYNGVPPFDETQLYVPRVLALYNYFRTEQPMQGISRPTAYRRAPAKTKATESVRDQAGW